MSNISQYIKEIESAEYGEQVRSSIVNALNKVNDDNNSYDQLKKDVIAAKDAVDEQVDAFNTKVQNASTTISELVTATNNGNTARSNLVSATNTANTAKTNLDGSVGTANTAKSQLQGVINDANVAKTNAETAKSNLDKSTSAAATSKSNLDQSTNTANTARSNLVSATNTANTAKTNLDGSVGTANTAKSQLQGVINDSETAKSNLSGTISTASEKKSALDIANATADENKTSLDTKNATATANISALTDANFNAREILTGVDDIKAYLGYTDEDIVGVQVDFKNKAFQRLAGAYDLNGGADFDKFEMFGGRKRCNVADDGTIVAWYGDSDYAEDGSMGQVMVYQPKFYYKVVPLVYEPQTDGLGYHLRKANYYVSTKPKTGFKLHPLFMDVNGNEIDFGFLSAFEGSIWDVSLGDYLLHDEQIADFNADKFCSIAGVKPASGLTQNLTRPNVEKLANNRGAGWHGDLIKAESANQMLMIIEMGMMNTQSAIGNGIVSISDNSAYSCTSLTGSTSSLGNTTGQAAETVNEINGVQTTYTNNGRTAITYRGVENPWGNIWKLVYGVNIWGNGKLKGGVPYICTDFNFAESKNSGNYESAGFTVSNANGYISAMGYSEEYDWLFFPSECTGNSSLPVGDYLWVTVDLNGYRIVLLGGGWNYGSGAGGFCWDLGNGVGGRYRNLGGRLVFIPTKGNAAYNANIIAWKQQMATAA